MIATLVRPGLPWREVRVVASTGSTNADLAEAARAGAASGLVLIAEHQSAGRGRFTRAWTAPPGSSLAISVLLRPPAAIPARAWTWLPLLTGLAVADGVAAAGVAPELKWPNDVLVDARKLCGILAERVEDAVVIGMGINTTLTAEQLPVPTATSLALAGTDVDAEAVAAAVLTALGGWYDHWLAGDDLRPAYTARCGSIGRPVRVQLSQTESVTGSAIGIDPDGRLLVVTAAGQQAFSAGDVVHLR